jgi:hypothetical protein
METENHYRVLRYFPSPGKGSIVEILGEDLNLIAAQELVRANPPVDSTEEVVVVDQNKPSYDDEVFVTTLRD